MLGCATKHSRHSGLAIAGHPFETENVMPHGAWLRNQAFSEEDGSMSAHRSATASPYSSMRLVHFSR